MNERKYPRSMAVGMPDPYVYRSVWKRAAAHVLDAVGEMLLAPRREEVDWSKVKKIAVLRLDHLGDVLHALPALNLLENSLPKAQVDLFVGPWSREAAHMAGLKAKVEVFEAPWFFRPARIEWPWKSILDLSRRLKAGGYGAAFELRGDLRHHLALWLAGIPVRAGHAVTAGKFLLTHPAVWKPGLHETAQNAEALWQAGLQNRHGEPPSPGLRRPSTGTRRHGEIPYAKVYPGRRAEKEAARVWKKLRLSGPVVAVQAACGTRAKRWMPERWARVLDSLPSGHKAVLLGSASEREEMESLARACKRRPALATGLLSLGGLAAFLKRCAFIVSVDSGPAHLAAAVGLPVLALYSGTNRAAQWGVRGPKVRLLQKDIECSPCELADCPFDNECMRRIQADEVLVQVRKMSATM